jgi:prolyl-tRNA synthetase
VLLERAGYVRRLKSGNDVYLPLAVRVLGKLERIVREELGRAGAEEIRDPGPTGAEVIVELARRELRSYRDLPKLLYQALQTIDAYSIDRDERTARSTYELMRDAYQRVFTRIGINCRMVTDDPTAMGAGMKFEVLIESGEDRLAICSACDYAASLEAAETSAPDPGEPETALPLERVGTPGQRTIQQVSAFLGAPARQFLKSLLFRADREVVMAVVRGDHELDEAKLRRVLGAGEITLASATEVEEATDAAVGFAGPVGFGGRVVVDREAAGLRDGIAGANLADHHLCHVQYGRDYSGRVAQIRAVRAGDRCPRCPGELGILRGIEIGHLRLLGPTSATYLDEQGGEQPMVMGRHRVRTSRLVEAIVEQSHDEDGIVWPMTVAPYQVHLVELGHDREVGLAALELMHRLGEGIELLVDDRDERPGVKFKDADLIGIPLRLTVGARSLAEGLIELKERRHPRRAERLSMADAARAVRTKVGVELDGRLRNP